MIALRRVRDHIDRHSREPLTLDDLAALAGLNKFHLIRAYRGVYGETPMRHLSRRRIAHAQDLLRQAGPSVTEICMLVGFSSLGSFSSRFTDLVGESPAAYRRRWAGRPPMISGCHVFMHGVITSIPEKHAGPGRP